MQRMTEGIDKDLAKNLEIGKDNAVCISGIKRWCKHVEVESEASGLYAEMTGLPINPHSIGCPQVSGKSSSMNVRWIVTDFLNEHCSGCPHHAPNGDTSWGQKIIDRHKEDSERKKRVAAEEAARLAAMRDNLRAAARNFSEDAEPAARTIIEHLESIFSEEEVVRTTASERIRQAAKLGADIIPCTVIEMILELATQAEFSGVMLPVLRELAEARPELNGRLAEVALRNIEEDNHIELSAALIEALGDSLNYPLEERYVSKLLLSQDHSTFKYIFPYKEPEYVHNTAVLARSYDAAPESVLNVIRRHLLDEDERVRFGLCGAVELIQRRCPVIADDLLGDLINSMELEETDTNDAPSSQIKRILKSAYWTSPETVDELISSKMKRVRPAVQEELVQVYESVFDKPGSIESSKPSVATEIARDRLLDWMKDEQIPLDVRVEVVDALKRTARNVPSTMLERFDALLGYLAIVSARETPTPPPSIVVPGMPPASSLTRDMDQSHTGLSWNRFKGAIQECLEILCRLEPQFAIDPIIECYDQPLEHVDSEFKTRCVPLLSQIGRDYRLRPQVMPLLWKAVTDYSSPLSIAKGLDAVVEMFPHKVRPPANLVEMLIIYLRDRHVVVHQAARRAVARRPNWFGETQSAEILRWLAAHLKHYKSEIYELDDICEAILKIGARHEGTKLQAFALVGQSFPTGERHVDENILKVMMRYCEPNDTLAQFVARRLSVYLGTYGRNRFYTYEHSERFRMFKWLHHLPEGTLKNVGGDLMVAAKAVAKRDAWESANFASLFGQVQDFQGECEVLEAALEGIPDEPRYREGRGLWRELAKAAKVNASLHAGD